MSAPFELQQRVATVRCLWFAVSVCGVIGCGDFQTAQKPLSPSAPAVTKGQPGPKPNAVTPSRSVELEVVDLNGYDAALAKLQGKVVLVDCWATWCAPCRKQFPHSVELHHKYQDRGFTVLSVSIDQRNAGETLDGLRGRVLNFLKEHQATFPNLVIPMTELAPGDPAATDLLAERLDLPGGSIPHFKLFDRQGNLVRTFFTDPETGAGYQPRDIDIAVEKLLEAKSD